MATEKQRVEAALCGGAVVPVPSLEKHHGYVIPHQSGEVVVEQLQALTVTWDTANDLRICLTAREELIVVPRRPLPVFAWAFSS